jgi:hypothetical protein
MGCSARRRIRRIKYFDQYLFIFLKLLCCEREMVSSAGSSEIKIYIAGILGPCPTGCLF